MLFMVDISSTGIQRDYLNKKPEECPKYGPQSTKKIDIVEVDMSIIILACFNFNVNRSMLTWGTFSTRAPSVDVMYFWARLSNGVK